MTPESVRPAAGPAPVAQGRRIVSIDVLRGFALLGILVMNVQSFSMIGAAYFNPYAYGDMSGANFAVWIVGRVLADQKFMTIFSLLFGAGILLMAERAEALGARPAGIHYRRMLWLVLFGLLHAHLLWYGDILYSYGMCGLVVYLFRKLRPGKLIVLGVLAVAVASAIWLFFGWSMQFWPEEQLQAFARDWQPPAEVVEEELAIYRGGWLEQMEHRVPEALELQTLVFLILFSWRAGGLMLVGMGLHKLGVFSARRSTAFYAGLVAVALLVGVPIVLFGYYTDVQAGWVATHSFFLGWQYNYWGSLAVAGGWIGLVMLACKSGRVPWLTRRLAAVGQMALTNYLLHTLICTTLFYGHGFGLFGRVERVGQAGIVAAIWAVQIVLSPIWLKHFRFGPFEWLWRSLTYMKLQPLRR